MPLGRASRSTAGPTRPCTGRSGRLARRRCGPGCRRRCPSGLISAVAGQPPVGGLLHGLDHREVDVLARARCASAAGTAGERREGGDDAGDVVGERRPAAAPAAARARRRGTASTTSPTITGVGGDVVAVRAGVAEVGDRRDDEVREPDRRPRRDRARRRPASRGESSDPDVGPGRAGRGAPLGRRRRRGRARGRACWCCGPRSTGSRPSWNGPMRRDVEPPGGSTRTTSAPRSASSRPRARPSRRSCRRRGARRAGSVGDVVIVTSLVEDWNQLPYAQLGRKQNQVLDSLVPRARGRHGHAERHRDHRHDDRLPAPTT